MKNRILAVLLAVFIVFTWGSAVQARIFGINPSSYSSAPRASAAAFSPSDVSNLYFWFKSDTGVTLNGSGVSAWANQASTGSNYDITQGTADNQPTFESNVLNGYPGVTFDGTNDFLAFGASGLDVARNFSGYTFFAVITTNTSTTNSSRNIFVASINGSTTVRTSCSLTNSNTYAIFGRLPTDSSAANTLTAPNTRYTNGSSHYVTFRDDRSANAAEIWQDGASVVTGAIGASAGNSADTNSNGVRIGALITTLNVFNGKIMEMLFYKQALSTSERQQVEQYLAAKYAL